MATGDKRRGKTKEKPDDASRSLARVVAIIPDGSSDDPRLQHVALDFLRFIVLAVLKLLISTSSNTVSIMILLKSVLGLGMWKKLLTHA